MNKILVIQTAFIGDVILATGLLETLHHAHTKAEIDIVVRRGNENLFVQHPYINKVWGWDKKNEKRKNLRRIIREVRKTKYDLVINLQRFASAGYLAFRSKAKFKLGFKNTPFSFIYDHKIKHEIGNGKHEVQRNFDLLNTFDNSRGYQFQKPRLYVNHIHLPKELIQNEYVVMAPSSVWETKRLPTEKWIQLIKNQSTKVYLIGAPGDRPLLEKIEAQLSDSEKVSVITHFSLLESTRLIQHAKRTFVNDSAPLHLASAINAPVTAFFCSTIPAFGFGPLSDDQQVVEVAKDLPCRPCGLHGKKECPLGHFNCGHKIDVSILK